MSDTSAVTYQPRGRITLASLMDLRKAGEAVIAQAPDQVVVDLSDIENGNSAGVALLIAWFREAERLDKSIVFRAVPADLCNIIELSGLTDVLPLADDHSNGAASGARQ